MSDKHPFSGKKVLISTPVFGGKVEVQYFASMMGLIPFMVQNGIGFEIMCEARNLIHQARNRAAHYALKNGFDKLLFIDSDITFKGNDVLLLLASDKPVVGGLYPLKGFPIKLNFTPKQGIYNGAETFNLQDYINDFADKKTGEVEVFMLPTGFMCVDVNVFRRLDPFVQDYHHRDNLVGKMENEKMYFPFSIAEDGFIYTEDWSFCDLVRNKLKEIPYWNTKVVVDHVGIHTFSAITPLDKSYRHLSIEENEGKVLTSDQILGKEPVSPEKVHLRGVPEATSNKTLPGPKQMPDLPPPPIRDVANPFSKWPRNLPCFCGSGSKFKKCCEKDMGSTVTPEEAKVLQPDFDKLLADVTENHEAGVGYKLAKTIYERESSDPTAS